jgi:hypothetical protein
MLLAMGLLQMTADLLHLPGLKGIAAATAASPAPKVFSSVNGLETFSTKFFVEWRDRAGQFHSTEITPERASGLRGPYNRRNVYGAVLAYGPVMQWNPQLRPMFDSVSRHAFCGGAPLLSELGIDPATVADRVTVRLEARPGAQTGSLPMTIEVRCQ